MSVQKQREAYAAEARDDDAAREALLTYAEETDDDVLADDLREWVRHLSDNGE